jgi:hypothetical protein
VNAVTNRIGTEAEVADPVTSWGDFLDAAARRRRDRVGEGREASMLALFCLAIRREEWLACGPLDEGFGIGLFEDDDYSVRLRSRGRSLICAEGVLVYHFGEASFGELVSDGRYGRLFERNRRRFERKHARAWSPVRTPSRDYERLLERARRSVPAVLPEGASLAVVSRGDERWTRLGSLRAEHFPKDPSGAWAGWYPADGDEAVRMVEEARRAGIDHLLFPAPGFWWLEHYDELRIHLENQGKVVMQDADVRLYRLQRSTSGTDAARPRPRPVFILGSPRSGTSVLTWALGQHPNLYPLEETVWFGPFHHGVRRAWELGTSRGERSQISGQGIGRATFFEAFGRTVDDLILDHRDWPEQAVSADRAYARARSPEDPKGRWVDGTPENSFHWEGLAELFPEARFLHLLRRPELVVRSLSRFDRIGGRRHTPDEAYRQWSRHVRACRDAEQALGNERILRVLHQDLVDTPESLLRDCLSFAGEPWSPDCLLPLAKRINSSGGDPEEPDRGPAPSTDAIEEARSLEHELFPEEMISR